MLISTFTDLPPAARCATVLTVSAKAGSGRRVSNYRIGAFEALEWVWHMLRGFKDSPMGVDEARRLIQEVLSNMGRGDNMDFSEEISKVKDPV